jgi:hypothetical protein
METEKQNLQTVYEEKQANLTEKQSERDTKMADICTSAKEN